MPAATPTLVLSESPCTLLEAMSRSLAAVRDPRARHWLILPARGRAMRLREEWALRSGIASHSQDVQLRDLIEQAAAADGDDRFNFERLRFAVAGALSNVAHLPGTPIPAGEVLEPVSAKILGWADSLARALDDAMLCRRAEERWSAGSLLEALSQDPAVQNALRSHIGAQDSTTFATATRRWISLWEKRGGIPHLWIQLDAGLPALQFERFQQLVQILREEHAHKLHLFALSPSREYWADCGLRSRKTAQIATPDLWTEPELHPGTVLWAFGRCSQDLHRQLIDAFQTEGDGGFFCESPEPPETLLGKLKLSCRRAAPLQNQERLPLDPSDASFTVHASRSTLRELEVCRDRILQARADMPDLRYEEILLLLADPKRQAPHVEAALRTDSGALPYRLFGFGQTVPSALAESLSILLEKIRGRLAIDDLQVLIENPLIAKRFCFQESLDSGQDLIAWLGDANFRWGIDAEHRADFQPIEEKRWNLHWAIQRLGLGGILAPNEIPDPVEIPGAGSPTLALDRASGLGLKGLARIAQFVETLQRHRENWCTTEPQTIAHWRDHLENLIEDMLDCRDPVPAQHRLALSNALVPSTLGKLDAPESQIRLTSDAFIRILNEKLSGIGESGARGPGGICVADLRQYAGVPARLIVVAGLNEDSFPRRDDRPGWHPLSQSRKSGDPSLRDADRHALLLAMLSCEERLVLSFQGGSDEDSKERPPSTALADLLQAVDHTLVPDAEEAHPYRRVLFSHPLNGFSPAAFAADRTVHQRSRLHSDFEAAQVLHNMTRLQSFPGPWSHLLPPPAHLLEAPKLTLSQLQTLFKEPARIFLERLGVRLPEEPESLASGDLLELDTLASWSLGDALLSHQLEGGSLTSIAERFEASGLVPPNTIGAETLKKLAAALPTLPDTPFAPNDRVARTIRLTLVDPEHGGIPWQLEGQLSRGWYVRNRCRKAEFYTASKDNLGRRLRILVEALALVASYESQGESEPLESFEFHFQKDRSGSSAKAKARSADPPLILKSPSPSAARQFLSQLLPLFRLAHSLPLPFWPTPAETMCETLQKMPRDPQRALQTAFEKWRDADGSNGTPSSMLPATRYCFRGCPNPFEWQPDLSSVTSAFCTADPLALQLVRFVVHWIHLIGMR